MTCALYWKPVTKEGNRTGDASLRNILEKKYGYPSVLDYSDLTYLEALEDAGIDGVTELVEAIRIHDEIEIYKEC